MTTGLSAGLGLKPQHFEEALASSAEGLWFEVHPENYMVAGGPRLKWLERARSRRALSLHGVAMSLAADAPPDPGHLERFRALVDRFQPALVSEHLAWSSWRGTYRPDLLPFTRTREALERVCANVSIVQDAIGREIAIENPSHYLAFDRHDYGEIDFLEAMSRRTGCGLLLDVNNVFVSARNLGKSAEAYLDAFPVARVREIHLAGHSEDPALGSALLVDSHDAPVADAVWALYARLIERAGPIPTLIERDGNLPQYAELERETSRAHAVLASARRSAAGTADRAEARVGSRAAPRGDRVLA
ncbi:MAG: DUF692 domain-containing protein [Burkholderiaceae bacterium]|nr:DUF692 domain-containing protein [Burkholderiaceae bacterium]